MKTLRQTILCFLLVLIGLQSCKLQQSEVIRDDFKKYYDQYNVEGSFVIHDPQSNQYIFYNKAQHHQTFTPASTFKICNALIGLETGVIKDEDFVIPWDSIVRQVSNWNSDQDLKTAFKNSTVWYYQELARRVGRERMKYWLDTVNYGNADTTGGIDKFWLTGGLRITPAQEIEFLKRLYNNDLPFSQRSMDIVKKIMVVKDTSDRVLSAKTGWGTLDKGDIGWYVGYLETNNKVYYFANCIKSPDPNNQLFAKSRIEITMLILDDLNLLKN